MLFGVVLVISLLRLCGACASCVFSRGCVLLCVFFAGGCVSEFRGFLFNKTRTQKLSFDDTVAIQLVAKSSTLLGFGGKSFPPLTLPYGRLKFLDD